jgi:hypothetical protein
VPPERKPSLFPSRPPLPPSAQAPHLSAHALALITRSLPRAHALSFSFLPPRTLAARYAADSLAMTRRTGLVTHYFITSLLHYFIISLFRTYLRKRSRLFSARPLVASKLRYGSAKVSIFFVMKARGRSLAFILILIDQSINPIYRKHLTDFSILRTIIDTLAKLTLIYYCFLGLQVLIPVHDLER